MLTLVCGNLFLMQELLVLETATAQKATIEMVEAHSIPSMVSKDLQDVLELAPEPLVVAASAAAAKAEAAAGTEVAELATAAAAAEG